jgi:hypothetical protein
MPMTENKQPLNPTGEKPSLATLLEEARDLKKRTEGDPDVGERKPGDPNDTVGGQLIP